MSTTMNALSYSSLFAVAISTLLISTEGFQSSSGSRVVKNGVVGTQSCSTSLCLQPKHHQHNTGRDASRHRRHALGIDLEEPITTPEISDSVSQDNFFPRVVHISDDEIEKLMLTPLSVTITEVDQIESSEIDLPSTESASTTAVDVVEEDKKLEESSVSRPLSRESLLNIGRILATNSGFVNAIGLGGFLGKKQALAAVTGTYTTSALAYANGNPFMMPLLMAGCYMSGSCLNGLLNPYGMGEENSSEPTNSLFLCGSLMAATGVLLTFISKQTLFLPVLTFIMGLQNSYTSMLIQGNILRTAHYSGVTSDIGTILGQTLRGNLDSTWKLPIFCSLAGCFWFGAYLSGMASTRWSASISCLASSCVYMGIWTTLKLRSMAQETSFKKGMEEPSWKSLNPIPFARFVVDIVSSPLRRPVVDESEKQFVRA